MTLTNLSGRRIFKAWRRAAFFPIFFGAYACSGATGGGGGGTEPDGGLVLEADAGAIPHADTGVSTKKDAAVPDPGGLELNNVSWGGSGYDVDITFLLTGSATIAKITSISLTFAGGGTSGEANAFVVDCSSAPWTSPSRGLVQITTSSVGLEYPCGLSSTRSTRGSMYYTSGSPALTVTLKGISTDATPWTLSATGQKR